MKKIISIILTLAFSFFVYGCEIPDNNSIYPPESSENLEFSSIEDSTSEDDLSDVSSTPIEEIHEFLLSEYVLTSTRESFGTTYVCEYYFIDGTVKGAKLTTTLSDESAAEEYFDIIIEDYPDSTRNGNTVTHYTDDEDHIYYGYKLDKLKFVLEKAGYAVEVNFDEQTFIDEFYTSSNP